MATVGRELLTLGVSLSCACMDYEFVDVDVDPGQVVECDFVQDEAVTEAWAYSCNPVFAPTDEDWLGSMSHTTFHSVDVLGHPFYQVWYIGQQAGAASDEEGAYQMGYATSDDGIEWTTHPDNPGWPERSPDDWDWADLQTLRVAWDPVRMAFLMLYGGIGADRSFFGAGVAASLDGQQWQLSSLNPVLPLGAAVNGVSFDWPLTLEVEDDGYTAYFGGSPASSSTLASSVYRLTTDDVERWDQPPTRVLSMDGEDGWDRYGVASADVVELNGRLYMFYVGVGDYIDHGSWYSVSDSFVGVAVSDDGGESWSKWGDQPLPLHRTTDGDVLAVAARTIGSRIHLWVTDHYSELDSYAIGYYLFIPE